MQTDFTRKKSRIVEWLSAWQFGYGAFVLLLTLVILSAIASFDFEGTTYRPFLAGEVATTDVLAGNSFVVQDNRATDTRRERVRLMQPIICDLTPDGLATMHQRILALFDMMNQTATPEAREQLRLEFAQRVGEELPPLLFQNLARQETQEMILDVVIPWLNARYADGIVSDIRLLLGSEGGVLVRNMANDLEILYTEPKIIPDIRTVQADLAVWLRSLSDASVTARRAAKELIDLLLAPTLIPNYDLTKARTAEIVGAIEPVVHPVQKGEMIVRQGERVSYEQHLKLQALGQRQSEKFQKSRFFGLLFISILIASGLFFSPNGKPSSIIAQKDLVFITSLVAAVAISSKALVFLGQKIAEVDPSFSLETLAYAMPIAGLAGLAALLFSTKRTVTTGLLLAFYSAIMYKGSLALFLFYFLSAMWNTWLIVRTQSRQDVVSSIVPLMVGLFVMWIGATCLQGGPQSRFIPEAVAVFAGAILSLFAVFAIAPFMEILFGYVTRFRLMELLNLDQPLLRELMIDAPGTYHHSLVVSQLVEAGAKSIDAHSLLCKVAALYHDIGKLTRPDYFIENQFGRSNPHDKLAPSMSALIILSHVKRGVELAQENRLGAEVIDIIRQHHGTNPISYFFQKAQGLGENPNAANYAYSGPKPQTREAAVVMLADIIEASSRTLENPTSNRLQVHINNIIKSLFRSGQLDEADLTLKDLNRLSKSFLQVLVGLFHQRIKYPPEQVGENPLEAHSVKKNNAPDRKAFEEKTETPPETNPLAEEEDSYLTPPQ